MKKECSTCQGSGRLLGTPYDPPEVCPVCCGEKAKKTKAPGTQCKDGKEDWPQGWESVSDSMPPPGVTVLAFYVTGYKRKMIVRAMWLPAKFEEADLECEFALYDEDQDKYFWPEGWYELVDNGDIMAYAIGSWRVSHWRLMPEFPEGCANG